MGLQDCAIHPDGPVAHALGSWRVDPTDAFWVELFRSICGFRDRRAGRAALAQGGPTASRRSGHVCETPGHGPDEFSAPTPRLGELERRLARRAGDLR